MLPGFQDALESAYRAWTTVISETDFARSVALAKDKGEEEFEMAVAFARIRSGIPDRSKIIGGLEQTVIPKISADKVYARIRNAVKDSVRNNDANKGYLAEFAAQPGISKMAHEANVVVSRKSSLARQTFVEFWTASGFWLVDPANALSFLETQNLRFPEATRLILPASVRTVRDWINQLGLKSYRGKGSITYDHHGFPVPDRLLIEEVGRASNSNLPPPLGSSYVDIGNSYIFNCRLNTL